MLDILLNVLSEVLLNLQKILFNYFGGLLVLVVQFLGFYYQHFYTSPEIDNE